MAVTTNNYQLTINFLLIFLISEIKCSLPQFINGIRKELEVTKVFRYGDNVTLRCEDGYTLEGSPWSQCQADGTWDPPLATCTPRKCKYKEFTSFPVMVLFIHSSILLSNMVWCLYHVKGIRSAIEVPNSFPKVLSNESQASLALLTLLNPSISPRNSLWIFFVCITVLLHASHSNDLFIA